MDRAEAHEKQRQRAKVTGISPKEGGNLTRPSEYSDVPDSPKFWGDWTNYRYPLTEKYIRAALRYWGKASNREQYSSAEQAKITAKIRARAKALKVPSVVEEEQETDYGEFWSLLESAEDVPPELAQKMGLERLVSTHRTPVEIIEQSEQGLGQSATDGSPIIAKVRGVATVADVRNSKGQIYPLQVWQNNMDRLLALKDAKKLLSQLDHSDTGKVYLSHAALAITDLYIQDNRVMFQGDILDTTKGRDTLALLKYGVPLEISSIGYGRTEQGVWEDGELADIVQDDYVCVGFDIVREGASPGASITDWVVLQDSGKEGGLVMEEKEKDATTEEVVAEATTETPAETKPESTTKLNQAYVYVPDDEQYAVVPLKVLTAMLRGEPSPAPYFSKTANPGAPKDISDWPKGVVIGGFQHPHSDTTVSDPEMAKYKQELEDKLAEVGKLTEELKKLQEAEAKAATARYISQALKEAPPTLRQALEARLKDVEDIETAQKIVNDAQAYYEAFGGPEALEANCDISDLTQGFGFPYFQRGAVDPNEDVKTPEDLISKLVERSSIPKLSEIHPEARRMQQDTYAASRTLPGQSGVPSKLLDPREALKEVLRNSAAANPGRTQWRLLYEQAAARKEYSTMRQLLTQALPTGGTAATDIAAAQMFIFDIYVAIYERLLLPWIASVQPLDRPSAMIFWAEYVGTSSGGVLDPSGGEPLLPMHVGEYFNRDYSKITGPACSEAPIVGWRLSSKTVSVVERRLQAVWEAKAETFAAAYHGIDMLDTHIRFFADEIAREINDTAINLIVSAVTSGSNYVTFGIQRPGTQYDQKQWDKELWHFIQHVSSLIRLKRNCDANFLIGDPVAIDRLIGITEAGRGSGWAAPIITGLAGTAQVLGEQFLTIKCNSLRVSNPGLILLVARGVDWSNCGMVYGPFSVEVFPPLTDPSTACREVGFMSLDVLELVQPDMFGGVQLTNAVGTPLTI